MMPSVPDPSDPSDPRALLFFKNGPDGLAELLRFTNASDISDISDIPISQSPPGGCSVWRRRSQVADLPAWTVHRSCIGCGSGVNIAAKKIIKIIKDKRNERNI